jgi:hypothetical protein
MKLWLDVDRQPDVDWVWSRTAHGAITMLKGGCVEKISFAPDQPHLVDPVVDWMIREGVPARRAVHKASARAKKHRSLLTASAPKKPDTRGIAS